ncbi:MAG: tetratricopeptide repeat protein [Bacteroidales bacterium]|nr:tetratricopeptide repeat protein [Bacteroidales bacterium]
MKRLVIVFGGLAFTAGCFAPFSWPEDRMRTDSPAEIREQEPVSLLAAPAPDALALAAACLDRGDEAGALPHLRAHVAAYPDAVMMRAYLAELLLKLGQPQEARAEFARVIHDADGATGAIAKHQVHCHTRLMEIAQEAEDPFSEELHRGIGLVLLVRQWRAESEEATTEPMTQQTLTKAVTALRSAREQNPNDPRPLVYLAEAYDGLGQTTAARAARRTARSFGPDAEWELSWEELSVIARP